MGQYEKRAIVRLVVGIILMVLALASPIPTILDGLFESTWLSGRGRLIAFLVPYIVIGWPVLYDAVRSVAFGHMLDENFLMTVATVGALCLGQYPEAVGVMIFFQIGELFQSYAVGKSRRSIAQMMDIAPQVAHVERDGKIEDVDPEDVAVGDICVVKVGDRVPLDGTVTEGASELDTSALTGESIPREVGVGEQIISGSVNLTALLRIHVDREYANSTVARILELVEEAADKKARMENFITRFARYYTPIVCGLAVLLALVPPLLFGGIWGDWIERGLIFLMVSCPCALVISVPLSFFGGIGAASRQGVLVKGSNYLEALDRVDTVVFDKTGTLTRGIFSVVAVHPECIGEERLLEYAAHAESYSTHPISCSIREAYGHDLDLERVKQVEEIVGRGVRAQVDGHDVLVGNEKLMDSNSVSSHRCELSGTILHVAVDGEYMGHIVIADMVKADAATAIAGLHGLGVSRCVMLTGDHRDVAASIAQQLDLDDYRAELLPQDKVSAVEDLLAKEPEKAKLAFVGDGVNDAPVLTRADVGIAMGALGSDAAIEAADIVLMNDEPSKIVTVKRIARRTMAIVKQNVWFALIIKFGVLILAAFGLANMWMAVFADVGVMVLAILNSMRVLVFGRTL